MIDWEEKYREEVKKREHAESMSGCFGIIFVILLLIGASIYTIYSK